MFVISGGLVSNVEAFDILTFFSHLGVNRSAYLARLTRSCRKSTSSNAHSICRHFRQCCINDGQPLKIVVSCPCIFGTLRRITISGISRPVYLYPHSYASTLSRASMRIGRILDSIVVWCPEFSMWYITTSVTFLKYEIFFGHNLFPHQLDLPVQVCLVCQSRPRKQSTPLDTVVTHHHLHCCYLPSMVSSF